MLDGLVHFMGVLLLALAPVPALLAAVPVVVAAAVGVGSSRQQE